MRESSPDYNRFTEEEVLEFAKEFAILRRNFLDGKDCHEGLYQLLVKKMKSQPTEWMGYNQPMVNMYHSSRCATTADARSVPYIPQNSIWGTIKIDNDVRLRIVEQFLGMDDSHSLTQIMFSNLWFDFTGKFVFAYCDNWHEYNNFFYELVVAPENNPQIEHKYIETHGNILAGGQIEWKDGKIVRLWDQSNGFPLPVELHKNICERILHYAQTDRLLNRQQSCLALYQVVIDPYRYWDDIYVPPVKREHDMLHQAASEILCCGTYRKGNKIWRGNQDFVKWLDANAHT